MNLTHRSVKGVLIFSGLIKRHHGAFHCRFKHYREISLSLRGLITNTVAHNLLAKEQNKLHKQLNEAPTNGEELGNEFRDPASVYIHRFQQKEHLQHQRRISRKRFESELLIFLEILLLIIRECFLLNIANIQCFCDTRSLLPCK